ncbi:MAG: NADH:flavin oxidoreductase/NADH oxidase [Thermoanaerobaculia bacterium]
MPHLFDPLTLRETTFRNRIGVSPMCQYSSRDGLATDWHLVHLGSRAVGGAGLVMVEATAVEARGRISPADMGLWSDAHVPPLARIVRFVKEQGVVAGIQLAHAGRKASTAVPWLGSGSLSEAEGGWSTIAPSAIPFSTKDRTPAEMTTGDIVAVLASFHDATIRAREAGFGLVELHAAHGYLAHSFLSPLSNRRADSWGGTFENRSRFVLEALRAIRSAWPDDRPVFVRLSCTDWVDGGWTLEDSVALARRLRQEGADLVDSSSGGLVPDAVVPVALGYQVPLSERIRKEAGIPTAAVGMITEPAQADEIVRSGRADLVLLAREELRSPYWPIRAAKELGHLDRLAVPPQYWRGIPPGHKPTR